MTENVEIKVFTHPADYTLSTIREMISDGDIILNPDYQRQYVYNKTQASKLIESFIIGIPIPLVYLSQEEDETLTVIDGQQRLTSINNFLNNGFALTGLLTCQKLNGKYYKDLDKPLQKKLKQSTISAIKILKESKDLKYEIFARLNQGAVALKPQELRNCIYRGSFNNMLESIANENALLKTLFGDDNKRKSYQERILRFFALRNFHEFKSSMKVTMNNFMYMHQNDEEKKIEEYKKLFNNTIDTIKQVLGHDAFYAIDRETNKLAEKFSGSVYDSIIIPFSYFSKSDLIKNADKIRLSINNIKKNDEKYKQNTYAATGDKSRVIGRINSIYNLLVEIVGNVCETDEPRLFPEEIKKQLFSPGCKCSYCGNEILSIDDAEVDHMVPFAMGGKTDISNAQLLHRHCNREKSNNIVENNSINFEDEEDD